MNATAPWLPLRGVAMLFWWTLACALAVASVPSARAVGASAAVSEFSSERAMVHVEAIARRPHPPGSDAHREVREYLVAALHAAGLEASAWQAHATATASDESSVGRTRIASVTNVIARRPGRSEHAPALLLVAHYDSTSTSRGAADDGAGVAALLETARALGTEPLRNDVIFLFTDGEESGLFGARAFVDQHPWAHDVGVALNFEARGSSGPVTMFQTSDDNAWLIGQLASAGPTPNASSLTQAIYSRMPNDTDFTELLRGKIRGLNFANSDGFESYHAPTDDPAHLDPGTLQQHGAYALSLARTLGNASLARDAAPKGNAVYFNVGPFFVRYAEGWSIPLALLAFALTIALVIVGVRTGRIRGRAAAVVLAASVGVVLVSALVAQGVWSAAEAFGSDQSMWIAATPVLRNSYLVAFVGIALALALAATRAMSARGVRPEEHAAGTLLLWAMASLAVAVLVPGASYVLVWPLMFASTSWIVALALAHAGRDAKGRLSASAHAVAMLPAAAIFAPLAWQLHVAFGPDGAPMTTAVVAWALVLLAPLRIAWIAHARMSRVSWMVPLGVSTAAIATALLVPPFGTNRPRPDTLRFAVDASADRAYWMTSDRAVDPYTQAPLNGGSDLVLPAFLTGSARASLPLHARLVRMPRVVLPTAVVVDDGRDGEHRVLRVRIEAPAGTELLVLHANGEGLRDVLVDGVAAASRDGAAEVEYIAPGSFELRVVTRLDAKLTLRLVAKRGGFPEDAEQLPGPRPAGWMARSGTLPPWGDLEDSDATVVARGFEL